MRVRLSRAEQTGENRELLLAAARDVFLEKGFHGATLEGISEHAGFSKGVVYSQFESKADLFLALLARRIEARGAQNVDLIASLTAEDGLGALARLAIKQQIDERAWGLLVLEFRVYAARIPELNARYREMHQRTVDGLTRILGAWFERSGLVPPAPVTTIVHTILAIDPGMILERTTHPDALPLDEAVAVVGRVLGDGFVQPVRKQQAQSEDLS